MDTKQVNDALDKLFQQQRIIFWNDPDHEFVDYLSESIFAPVEGVQVIRLDQTGALEAKLQIERDDPNGKFLIYSPAEEPNFDDDWLLDIRLYSHSFRADRASIVLEELGLQTHSLADHLKKRQKFCDNKDRLQKLKAIVIPEDQSDDIDRKMLAVTVKAEQPELYINGAKGDRGDQGIEGKQGLKGERGNDSNPSDVASALLLDAKFREMIDKAVESQNKTPSKP